VQLWPTHLDAGGGSPLDRAEAWDAGVNRLPRWGVRDEGGGVWAFRCPSDPAPSRPLLPRPTSYVGVAGLGDDAAGLPLSDPRTGFFGYDRVVRAGDIKDGQGETMAVAEVVDGGPWTAGGRATVRGLSPAGPPYLGRGGQFGSAHRGGGYSSWSRPVLTNVIFADGSCRPFTGAVSPGVFEALATIAGGEEVGPFDQ
jgi:Protein of unknown function (DUF1559)